MGYGDGGRGGNGSTTLGIIAILALVVAAILAVILLVRPPPPVVCKPGQELVVQCRDKPVETPCYDDCDRHRDREEVVTTLVPDGDPYLTDAVNELWNSVDAQIRHFNDPETLLAIDRADDVALYCIARRHHDPEFVLDAVLNSVANTDLRRDRLRLAQEPLAGLVFPGPELAVVNERCPEKTEREDERKGLPVVPWGPRDQAGRTPVGLIGGAPEPATEGDAGRAARFLEDSDAREYRACEKPRVTSLFINGIDTTQDDAELASNLMFKGLETVFSDKTLSCALAKESNSAGEDQCRAPVFGDRVNEDIDGDPTDVGRSDWDDLSDSEKTALYGRPGIAHYFAYNWSEDEAPTESFWQRFDALDLKDSKAIREVRKELDSRREADPSFPPNPSAWLDENLSIKFNPQSNDSSTI